MIVSNAGAFLVFSQRTHIIWCMVMSNRKTQVIKHLGFTGISIPAGPVLKRCREGRLGHHSYTPQGLPNRTSVFTTTVMVLITQWWSFNERFFIETVKTALNKPGRKMENLDLILQVTARDLMLSKTKKRLPQQASELWLACFLGISLVLKIMLVNFAIIFVCSLLDSLITTCRIPWYI